MGRESEIGSSNQHQRDDVERVEVSPLSSSAAAAPPFIASRLSPRADLIDILASRVVKIINENVEEPIQQALDRLPADSASVRKLPFYDATFETLRFQRDNYLVGPSYAERKERQRRQPFPSTRFIPQMPFDATALGHIQLVHVGAWFIPSETIRTALLPIVVSLPSGALKDPIINTVSTAIPLAQPPLDRAVKSAILDVMDNPHMRQLVKNRTQRVLRVDDVKNDEVA
jgi:hypothetical protein